ncbi:hypothetical protein FOPG_17027 [Fusarium oxysporum f. sp. conglutinans race 2 54008]|uniref:Uncharacterized protein n=1 Tax=Fusarium oxysporum f. sp. conglutinans race 2 54008 TaxID=1089457 RepID=X0I0I1_FUSOX|nr:hypothetical protein FOPG_17027 [Fusarium oxysporum f. sp. conglutinans race 2 54008]
MGVLFTIYVEALQHEMVIPRTPSPEQPTAKALTEDILSKLSEEEICYLSEKLCELQAKQDSQRIKREANSPPRGQKSSKLVRLENLNAAVDLTED